jgi:5'-nucleotidase
MLPPSGTLDKTSLATTGEMDALQEIKEWQAIMDHLRRLPVEGKDELPMFPVDERSKEVRAIKAG